MELLEDHSVVVGASFFFSRAQVDHVLRNFLPNEAAVCVFHGKLFRHNDVLVPHTTSFSCFVRQNIFVVEKLGSGIVRSVDLKTVIIENNFV